MKGSSNTTAPRPSGVCFLCGAVGGFVDGYEGIGIEGRSYDIRFCPNCSLGRTEPFPDPAELDEIYSCTYREEDFRRFFSPIEKTLEHLKVRRCKEVERFAHTTKGRILDVGCGRGDFPLLMSRRGWNATGLELDPRIESRGKEIGVDLRSGSLVDAKFSSEHFDVVTFWHVFEHIRDPDATLRECARILKPGGLLVIAVPNSASLQSQMMGRHWFHLDPPYHLYHYSPANLATLLDRGSFKVGAIRHFSLEYNPYGFFQSFYNALGLRPNLLYDFFRSRGGRGVGVGLSLALILLSMPVILPLSLMLSVLEAALGRGGTIDIYATKRGGA